MPNENSRAQLLFLQHHSIADMWQHGAETRGVALKRQGIVRVYCRPLYISTCADMVKTMICFTGGYQNESTEHYG